MLALTIDFEKLYMTFDALEEMTIEMGCWNSKGKVRKSKAREMMQKNSSAHGEGSGAGKPGVYAKKPGNSSSSKKKTGGSQSRAHKGHKPGGSVPPSKRPSKRPSASSSAAAVAAAEADPQGAKELDDLDKHGKMQAKRMKERRKCPHKRGGKGGGSAGGGQPLIVSGKGESRKPAPAKKDPHGPPIIVSGKSSRNPSRAKASSSASASRSGGSRASSSSSAGISREERKSRAGKVVDEYRDGFRGGDSPSPSRGKPRGSSERPSIRDPKQPRPPPPSPPPPPSRPPQQKGGGGPKLENDGYLKKQPKPENVINFQGGASGKASAARGEAGSRHEHHPPARRSKMGAHIASRMPRKSGRRKERSESESKTGEKGGPRDLSKMRRNYAEDLVRRSKAPCPPCGDATDCEHVQEDKVPVVSSDSESKYGIDVKPEPTREELAPMKPKKRMGDVEDIGPPQGFFPPVLDIRLRVGDKEDRPRREVYLRYPHEGAEGHVEVIKGDVAESETAQVDMMQTGGQKPNIEKPKRRSSSRSSRSSAM